MHISNYPIYDTGSLIYPGDYVPVFGSEQIQEEFKRVHKIKNALPQVSLTELHNSYKIEVAIPGLNREDFTVQINGNRLSVSALQHENRYTEKANIQTDITEYVCFSYSCILPPDSATDFISAEYKAGILCLGIFKTKYPDLNSHTNVVVY